LAKIQEIKMSSRFGFVACSAFLTLSGVTSAVGAEDTRPTAALQKIIEGAQKEGRLQLVWGNHILGGAAGAKEAEKLINAKFGTNISIQFTTGPSGPTIRGQLVQEQAAGQPATTDVLPLADAATDKIWSVIDWHDILPSVPEDAMYLNKKAVAIATPISGITYNSKLVPDARSPKSLADLLKAEWKGKIATTPYIFGAQFFGRPELLGPEKTLVFQQALAKQIGGLIRCGEEDRILSGEFLIFAVDCGQYEVVKRSAAGQPLGWNLPTEGAVAHSWLAGVPIHSAHPNSARLFVAFLLTPEGQEFVYRVQGMDSWKLSGSKTGKLIQQFEASGIRAVDANKYESEPEMLKLQEQMTKSLHQ
jgi:ABC-type Fe3+ transport system substrate-binding protein